MKVQILTNHLGLSTTQNTLERFFPMYKIEYNFIPSRL
ncbi:hypothetical protein LEP1GSC039_3236 [Leptospira santarosai str. 2000027870]|nr:hypothetical protein LEP1GSC039_3236 [Leptospira santarosai str. 2000027870]